MKKQKASTAKSMEKIGRRRKKIKLTPMQEYNNRVSLRRKRNKIARKSRKKNRK